MTGRSEFNIKSIFLTVLILMGLEVFLFSQDKKISNIINIYKKVEAIGAVPHDNVTLNDVNGLTDGDTVLLIQMKGVEINVVEGSSFGSFKDQYGYPGFSEFLIVESINTGTRNVVFTSNIINNFDIKGTLQLVRVPYYNSATVTSTLTCQPWDSISKTGGVLVMIIGRTLSLEADIDISGRGFIGGITTQGDGTCIASGSGLDDFGYAASYSNSGYKGESPASRGFLAPGNIPPLFPNYAKGKGSNFTGGGGGNGRFSGGGGGSNWGLFGGGGGTEDPICPPPRAGGLGGRSIKNTDVDQGFFMGGGGGASTHGIGVTTATPGGSGGGIIIIICDTIKGNGNIITANGGTPNSSYPSIPFNTNAGAGGGGGGGSIALYLQSYSSNTSSALTISVKGGKGGNTDNTWGVGGGGGGGLILTNNLSKPANVVKDFSGGAGGTKSGGSGQPGASGDSVITYTPLLNGFLYNSIRSQVTGDQVDSICSNMPFGVISGTIPFSGTIQWQSSITSESAGFTDISGATSKDYLPGILTQTTWFRRVVTDAGPPVIIDISKPVKIIVQPFIKDNIIGDPDTLCYAQDAKMLVSKAALQDGNGIYSFMWKVSVDNTLYSSVANTDNTESYTPVPGLTQTSWFRRTVTSGRCVDSSAIVRINVLDTISNNKILNAPEDICFGMTFTDLTATTTSTTPALSGGDASYRYLWESSINGTTWGSAPGVKNLADYFPEELPERAPLNEYKFRRVVKSGSQNVCVSTSPEILLRDYPVLTNNYIVTAEQNVCSGSAPSLLTGSDPLNGDGTYTYIWQDSSKSNPVWTDITGAAQRDYQPPALTDTTSYRRKVLSSACSDISKSVRINVHKPLTDNIISLLSTGTDTVICDGANPNRLIGTLPTGGTNLPGDYAYEWQYSTDNSIWNPVASGTTQGYDPPALNVTTYYRRKVLSGACIDISAETVKVEVLPLITNNTLTDPAVTCKDYVPDLLTGSAPAGGDGSYLFLWEQSVDGGTTWISAVGVNNDPSGNYQPPALGVPTKYKRKVTSGANNCCSSLSNIIEVLLNTNPMSAIFAGPDTVLYSFDNYYQMKASPIFDTPATGSYETGKWSIITGTADFDNDTRNDTKVTNLSPKLNSFLWTVTNGPCINKDTVNITIEEIIIPNGFSPNNDGINDVFEILGLDINNQVVELSIVNSAGTEVFYSSNRNGNDNWSNWDGKNSKGVDLPEGTYYYILKLESKEVPSLRPHKPSGFIVLKRR
ncbi:MAG TPA: gliding motility-associated C-terminal domain-containing protein [Bacteroidales bacterium]|nr:gliding motility-associated C-terminal domain-containing protein [Bacteroidales bacterium]